jgi:hypothetical protein
MGMTKPEGAADLFSDVDNVDLLQRLIAELHDDLPGRLSRLRYLVDISSKLGAGGTMMPGGETTYTAWVEARSSFVSGQYMATVMLCQALAEHILAAYLQLGLTPERLPKKITFEETLKRCVGRTFVAETQADDLRRLMLKRNPLSHFRTIDDPHNLSRRVLDTQRPAAHHLRADATFAIKVIIDLLAGPLFSLSGTTLLDP